MHLHALQAAYLTARKAPLTRHIKSSVDGHLKDMYLMVLEGAKKDTTGAWRDAKRLHKAMEGFGTKDELLILRYVFRLTPRLGRGGARSAVASHQVSQR